MMSLFAHSCDLAAPSHIMRPTSFRLTRSLVEMLHPTLVPAIARASFPVEAREDLPSHLVLDRLRGFFAEVGNRVRASTPFFQYVSNQLSKRLIDPSETFQHIVVVMIETDGAAEYLINERTQATQTSVRLVSTAIAEKWKTNSVDYKRAVAESAVCALAEAEIQALASHALSLVRVPICAHSRVASLLLIMAAQGGAEWRKAAYERVPLDCKSLCFADFEELSARVRNDPPTTRRANANSSPSSFPTESIPLMRVSWPSSPRRRASRRCGKSCDGASYGRPGRNFC